MYSSANECQNFVSHKVDDTLALYHMLLRLALPSASASPCHVMFSKERLHDVRAQEKVGRKQSRVALDAID
jgi:hypothetical protein